MKRTLLIIVMGLVGCSSSDDMTLLPDAGPTTVELLGTSAGYSSNAYFGSAEKADYLGNPLFSQNQGSESSYSSEHIRELQRDFKLVPNPDVVGYVYPHINNNEMPIPGYFTLFKLYDREHYALTDEGYNVE